jgi:hypothetical protein
LIALDDPTEATSMLRGMMIMEPQRATVLGQREPPGADEIAARGTLREAVPGAMRGPPRRHFTRNLSKLDRSQ